MGRSCNIFSGEVSKIDFDNWENEKDESKVLYFGFDENKNKVAYFCPSDKVNAYIEEQYDSEEMKKIFEEDYSNPEKELFNYYGFYKTPKDFKNYQQETDGEYKYDPIDDNKGILIISVNI